MKRSLTEETLIFLSILKWFALATVVGLMVGFSTAVFLKALKWCSATSHEYAYYFALLPAALIASHYIVKALAPDAEGHGTEKVIEAVHKNSGRIKLWVVPVKLVATLITLAFGGSVGKEGPCAQIGAGVTSAFADLLKFDDYDRKKLVICGISAGFASVFGTPISGAIFGIEVLVIGMILYDVLFPSFIAGLTAYQVSASLGVSYFYHPLGFTPVFSEAFLLKVVLSGVFFGVCSFLLIKSLREVKHFFEKLKGKTFLKILTGGLFLVLLTLIFSDKYLGLGLDGIESALQGSPSTWYDPFMKILFTSVTLNFGGSGGIVTPIFYIGATAGSLFAQIFHLDPATFAAIGFASLLAGAANTPIAACILVVELFGDKIAPYAAIACVISFLMTGHRSVYPSQILGIRKSASIEVEFGKEIEKVKIHIQPEKNEIIAFLNRIKSIIKEFEVKK